MNASAAVFAAGAVAAAAVGFADTSNVHPNYSIVSKLDAITLVTYAMSWLTLFNCAVLACAFARHSNATNDMVRHLCRAVFASCVALGLYTLFWDVGLRTKELVQFGYVQTRQFMWITRVEYMLVHFIALAYVAYELAQFLRLTIPEDERHKWPWYRAPLYPNRWIFW